MVIFMDNNDKKLADYLADINNSIQSMQNSEHVLSQSQLPSNIKIMFGGINDNQLLNFLFSTGLDKSLDGIFNAFMKGDYSNVNLDINDITNKLSRYMTSNDKKPFEGELSKRFINNIQLTMQTGKFNKTKTNIAKCMQIIRNLKKEAKTIEDKEKQKKFKDAIYAFKKILKLVRTIYKNRDIVSKRALNGINAVVFENYEYQNRLEKTPVYLEPFE